MEPDVAVQVPQHGAGVAVPYWARLLRCTECGARNAGLRGQRYVGSLRAGRSAIGSVRAPD
jgi:hypothetical protein